VQVVGATLWMLLSIFALILLVRLVAEVVQSFARNWRASGWSAMLLEITYSITDPPVKLARRLIKPIRIGGIGLDLAFLAVMVAVYLARWVVGYTML
jgi:YggT family protein